VVECGSLENYCAATYRGFESLSLRLEASKLQNFDAFFMLKLLWI